MVVGERPYRVTIPSVRGNMTVKGGWSLMRVVVIEEFYCMSTLVSRCMCWDISRCAACGIAIRIAIHIGRVTIRVSPAQVTRCIDAYMSFIMM